MPKLSFEIVILLNVDISVFKHPWSRINVNLENADKIYFWWYYIKRVWLDKAQDDWKDSKIRDLY